ncbi:MAG: leucyl/phenylalanyl-tRNA--protein transferase [Rhodospirillales bacterium]|nr:leucyl/phenylalanyl-tRNA--protein transferase [Rhodospirillales bacterium]
MEAAIRAIGETDHLTPEMLLRAYAIGIFPMAENARDPNVFWISPQRRGIIPLDGFRIPRRLRRTVRRKPFEIRFNHAFASVMHACAEQREQRHETWINGTILRGYTALHRIGHAHSVEAWNDGRLVGGLYGVSLGGAFFGESMFSIETDASKVALVYLIARLRRGGFDLLDIQFVTDHLRQFGAEEISAEDYLQRLDEALLKSAVFYSDLVSEAEDLAVESLLAQSRTQTS